MAFAFNRRLSFVRRPAETTSDAAHEESEQILSVNNEENLAAITPIFDPQSETAASKQDSDGLKDPAIA